MERIAELGELHHGRKERQPQSEELRRFSRDAREALKHSLVKFDEEDVRIIAESLGRTIREPNWTCYACAIMPDHVHALIRRHRDRGEQMIELMQQATRQALVTAQRRDETHPVWGGPGWDVFLNARKDMERIVEYVRANPTKIGLPEQRWPFVKEYDGWLPRPSF